MTITRDDRIRTVSVYTSSGQAYNYGNSRMAQLCIWSRALNESELNANMYLQSAPTPRDS